MRLDGKRLTGPQIEEFRQAIRDAFNNEQEFKEFLLIQFNKSLEDITSKETFTTEIFNVITVANTEDWTEELLRAARLWRPTNTKLLIFATQFGLVPSIPSEPDLKSALERMVRPNNKVVDVALWRTKLEQIEGQICRVEVRDGGETIFGTGFLVGPDVVMTNYHVVKDVIVGNITHEHIALLFDFKKTINISSPGIYYHLAERDWCVDYSEYSTFDEAISPWERAPEEDKLDYALMRLSARAGEERIGGEANKNPNAPLRGWIEVSAPESKLTPGLELFVVQHKDGDQLTLALDTHSIIRMNTNSTRVFYKTNTDEGSSGAPCFDIDWRLVALHQGGDPNFSAHHQPEYNQGIPLSAIVKLLKNRGKLSALCLSHDNEITNQHLQDSIYMQDLINQESNSEKQETNNPSPYELACKHFHEAYTCLQKACNPLQEEMYIPPATFQASIRHLQEMRAHIQGIIECLQIASSLPLDIAKEHLSIIHTLRMVDSNVMRPLLQHLFQNKSGDFVPTMNLMHTIKRKLLPDNADPLQEV